jgi:hypothetical protein
LRLFFEHRDTTLRKQFKTTYYENKITFITFFSPSIMMAKVTQGFENVLHATFNPVSDFCEYFDADATTIHTLANYAAPCGLIYVTETGSATTIGYSIILDPTTANGPIGFTDTDFFGVASAQSFIDDIGLPPLEGTQGFYMEDVDGTVTMIYDLVALAGTTNLSNLEHIFCCLNFKISIY